MLIRALIGTLGRLAQVAVNSVNYLRVQQQGRGDAETNNGNAFIRGVEVSGVAANFHHSQIKNPAASGKTVYVDEIRVSGTTVNEAFDIGFFDTDLTTLIGACSNKNAGGAASSAQTRHQQHTAQLAATFFARVSATSTHIDTVLKLEPPIRLDAGEGLVVVNASANVYHRAVYQIREY